MTDKQAALIAFLKLHGPARYVRGSILKGDDGFTFRITKSWLRRYANDGLIARKTVRSPKLGILTPWYDIPESLTGDAP